MGVQSITLYWRPLAPNPFKVLIILEELKLPYTLAEVAESELKTSYESVCINGRVPAIHDPNTDITLWESCAIISYLLETYDDACTLSVSTSPEIWQLKQWQYFQSSGQGPYFGQMSWFLNWQPDVIPSAQDRYVEELHRIVRVLDRHLQGRHWLVGEECTYADLGFYPWNSLIELCLVKWGKKEWDWNRYPAFKAWHARLGEREGVKRALAKMGYEDAAEESGRARAEKATKLSRC